MVIYGIDLWIVFYTIIILLTIICIIIVYQYQLPNDDQFKRRNFSKIKKKLRTGDIIVISYDSYRGKLVKIFTGSSWTHCGMIYKDKDKLYVIEMARYSSDERGLILKPLDDWIDWNIKYNIAIRKYTGIKKFPKRKLKHVLDQSAHFEEDFNVTSWLKTIIDLRYDGVEKDYFYCSEFITYAMQKIGVLKKIIKPSSYKPWQLLYGKLHFNKGYTYSNTPILINFD